MEKTKPIEEIQIEEHLVYLTGEISDQSVQPIIEKLDAWDRQESGSAVTLYIDSAGGSIAAGNKLRDTINCSSLKVTMIARGVCMSKAADLIAGHTKGERKAYPSTKFMIHNPFFAGSNMKVTLDDFATLEEEKNNMIATLAAGTGKSKEEIEKDLDHGDFFMSAKEALDYGLIDYIL